MKRLGDTLDFTEHRNSDLIKTFRLHLQSAPATTPRRIFELVAKSPASRFWVSEQRAAIVISAKLAGKKFPKMLKTKQEMFDEIYRRFRIMRSQHPEKTIIELASMIVHQPAPEFYLTPRTVEEYIYHIRRGWDEK